MMTSVRRTLFFAALGCLAGGGLLLSPIAAQRSGPAELALINLSGNRKDLGILPAGVFAPRVSPDGKQVAYDLGGAIWIADLSNVSAPRKLSMGGSDNFPLWTPDGQRVVFTSARDGGVQALYWQRADGSGDAEQLVKPARSPESWSVPGQLLSFITLNPPHDYDIWKYSVQEKRAEPLIATAGTPEYGSRFSHDGRWVAYETGTIGATNVWVQPYPLTGAKFQITTSGGSRPLWSPDDSQLFFDHNSRMFVVSIQTKPTFKASDPMPLPIHGFVQGPLRRQYDIMPDGTTFLMMFGLAPAPN